MKDYLIGDIEDKLGKLKEIKGDDNWLKVRNAQGNYALIVNSFSFGDRKCFKRIEQDTYEGLQASRGIASLSFDDSPQRNIELAREECASLGEANEVRVSELLSIGSENDSVDFGNKLVELGFRVPKIMKYFNDTKNFEAVGYDVVDINIAIGKSLGYDVRKYDFNSCKDDLDLGGAGVIVSYHMLEHLTNPFVAVKKVYDSMDSGSYFHVEIPVEPGIPRIRYGHMFAFEQKDLYHMLVECGFEVLFATNKTHTGGPHIERYLAKK